MKPTPINKTARRDTTHQLPPPLDRIESLNRGCEGEISSAKFISWRKSNLFNFSDNALFKHNSEKRIFIQTKHEICKSSRFAFHPLHTHLFIIFHMKSCNLKSSCIEWILRSSLFATYTRERRERSSERRSEKINWLLSASYAVRFSHIFRLLSSRSTSSIIYFPSLKRPCF